MGVNDKVCVLLKLVEAVEDLLGKSLDRCRLKRLLLVDTRFKRWAQTNGEPGLFNHRGPCFLNNRVSNWFVESPNQPAGSSEDREQEVVPARAPQHYLRYCASFRNVIHSGLSHKVQGATKAWMASGLPARHPLNQAVT